ncbi:hypothetical protein KAS41_01130 [Candidatus Parcubacteria bacterium]|nr:hypothetical protein [Candidatus Parcubacteria bacterium]
MEEKKIIKKEDLLQLAKDQGKKLGFLISSLNASDETKEAMLFLVEDMNLEQLEKMTEVLEAKFIGEQTPEVEEDFKKELEEIIRETVELGDELNKNTLSKIKDLKIII